MDAAEAGRGRSGKEIKIRSSKLLQTAIFEHDQPLGRCGAET
jgi:hypothetical protein